LISITSPSIKVESHEIKNEPQRPPNENRQDDKLTLSGKIPKKVKPNEHPNTTNKQPSKDIPRRPEQKTSSLSPVKKTLTAGTTAPANTAVKPMQKSVSSEGTKAHPALVHSIKPHSSSIQPSQKLATIAPGASSSGVKKTIPVKSTTHDQSKKPLLQKRPPNTGSKSDSSNDEGSFSENSSSGSDSNSETSDSEIDQSAVKKKKLSHDGAAVVVKKRPLPEKKSDSVRKSTSNLPINKKGAGSLKQKEEIVQEILKRWWYVIPEWPPANFNYADLLVNAGLRKVDLEIWKLEPNVDEAGKKKVFELEWFKGVFKDFEGKTYDFRPRDSCPCYSELNKKDKKDLLAMLKTALDNQISSLEGAEVYDPKIQKSLSKDLNALRSQVVKLV